VCRVTCITIKRIYRTIFMAMMQDTLCIFSFIIDIFHGMHILGVCSLICSMYIWLQPSNFSCYTPLQFVSTFFFFLCHKNGHNSMKHGDKYKNSWVYRMNTAVKFTIWTDIIIVYITACINTGYPGMWSNTLTHQHQCY
jgi:hypothetical protein